MFEAFAAPLWIGLIAGLLIFAVVVTLISNALVALVWRRRGQGATPRLAVGAVLASLIWIALVFVAGVIAARYLERLDNPLAGYVFFGIVAGVLSLGRATLYRRAQEEGEAGPGRDWRQSLEKVIPRLVPVALYLAWATVLYFVLSVLAGAWIEWVLLLPLFLGALLPDLDSPNSALGRLFPRISGWLTATRDQDQPEHSGILHTPLAAAVVALIAAPLILVTGWQAWALIISGHLSHLVLDLARSTGLMLLWPLRDTRTKPLSVLGAPGGVGEGGLAVGLLVVAVVMLFFVDVGRPLPPPAAAPTYEQSLARYYDLRGRNLVFADVEGTWQATRRRISDRYEILDGAGETLIMLDRYTGRVFTAGRGADDNLYLNRLAPLVGVPVQIKGAEIHLEDQPLSDAVRILYEMEREPGLEHIFVSGDVFLAPQDDSSLILRPDYGQTSLRKIELYEPGHYGLHYLTAAELIGLAQLPVEQADLVVVATYATTPTGPTPTPLPRLPGMEP